MRTLTATLVSSLALLSVLPSVAQAATHTTTEYTVNYDDSTVFGGVGGWGGSSGGAGQTLFFTFNAPFDSPFEPTLLADGGRLDVALPSFTLVANPNYVFKDLTISLGGARFSLAKATGAYFVDGALGTLNFASGTKTLGPWTLNSTFSTGGTYTSLTFSGGNFTLDGTAGGALYVENGPKFEFTVQQVPEPEAMALLLAGLGVVGLMGVRTTAPRRFMV